MTASNAWVNLFMDLLVRPYVDRTRDAPPAPTRSQNCRAPVDLRTCVVSSFAKSRSADPKPHRNSDVGIVIALYAVTAAFALGTANQILISNQAMATECWRCR
jgi:hypothetical protein